MADSITTKNPATQTATVAKTNTTAVKPKNPKDILFEQISISENYLNEGLSSEEDNFSFGGTIGRNLFLGPLGTVSAFQEVSQHYDKKGNYRQALKELAELRTQIAKGEISLENAKIKLQEIDQKLIQKQDTIRQYTVDAANAKAVGAGIVAVGAGIGVAVLAPQVAAGLLLGVEVTGITITTAGIVATTTAGTQITLTAAQATSFLALTGAITTGYSATTQVVTEGVNGNLNKPETWKAIAGQALIEGTVNVAFLGLEPFGKLMNPKIMKTLGIMGVSPDVATKAAPLLSDLTFFTGTGITSGTAEYYLTLALNPSLTAEEKQKLMNEKGVQIMASALLGVGFRAVLRGVSKNGNSARTTLTASQKELKPDDANELKNLVIQIIKKADLNDDSQKPLIQALNGVRDKLKNNNSIALDDLTFIIQQSNKYGLEKEVNQLIPKIDPSLAKLITIAQKLEKGTITADDVIELENLAKNNGVPKSQIEEVKALVRDTENSASGSIKVRQAPTAPLQAVTTSKTTSVLPKATTTPTSVTPWNAPKPPIGANNIVPFNAPKAPTHLERILNDLTPQQKSKLGELSPAQMERFNGIIQSNINNRITLGEENPVIKQEVIDGALNMAKSGSEVPLSMTMMAGSGQTDDLINALKKIETQTQTPADEAKTRYGATTYTPQSLAITTTEDWKANIEERIIKLITNGNNFIVYQNCEKPDRWIAGVKQVLDALGLNFEVYSFPSSEPNKTSIILKLLSSPSQAQTGTTNNINAELQKQLQKIETQTQTPADEFIANNKAKLYDHSHIQVSDNLFNSSFDSKVEKAVRERITKGNDFIYFLPVEDITAHVVATKRVAEKLGLPFDIYTAPDLTDSTKTRVIAKFLSSPATPPTPQAPPSGFSVDDFIQQNIGDLTNQQIKALNQLKATNEIEQIVLLDDEENFTKEVLVFYKSLEDGTRLLVKTLDEGGNLEELNSNFTPSTPIEPTLQVINEPTVITEEEDRLAAGKIFNPQPLSTPEELARQPDIIQIMAMRKPDEPFFLTLNTYKYGKLEADDNFVLNLQLANLARVDLRLADLKGINLEKANLEGSDLTGAWFDKANLSGVNLTNATIGGFISPKDSGEYRTTIENGKRVWQWLTSSVPSELSNDPSLPRTNDDVARWITIPITIPTSELPTDLTFGSNSLENATVDPNNPIIVDPELQTILEKYADPKLKTTTQTPQVPLQNTGANNPPWVRRSPPPVKTYEYEEAKEKLIDRIASLTPSQKIGLGVAGVGLAGGLAFTGTLLLIRATQKGIFKSADLAKLSDAELDIFIQKLHEGGDNGKLPTPTLLLDGQFLDSKLTYSDTITVGSKKINVSVTNSQYSEVDIGDLTDEELDTFIQKLHEGGDNGKLPTPTLLLDGQFLDSKVTYSDNITIGNKKINVSVKNSQYSEVKLTEGE